MLGWKYVVRSARLEIISSPILAADPLAEFVGRFHRRYPNVRVRIATPDGKDVLDLIRNGTFEVGLTIGPIGIETGNVTIGEGLNVVALPREEVLIAFGPEVARAGEGEIIEARDLKGIPLVVDPRAHAAAVAMLAEHGVECTVAIECFHREAIVPLVLAGAGAALLLPRSAERARQHGAVVCRVRPPIHRSAVLVHRPHDLTAAGSAFVNMITARQRPQSIGRPRATEFRAEVAGNDPPAAATRPN